MKNINFCKRQKQVAATKENDVTSAAEETLQFDDSGLRGENLKYRVSQKFVPLLYKTVM